MRDLNKNNVELIIRNQNKVKHGLQHLRTELGEEMWQIFSYTVLNKKWPFCLCTSIQNWIDIQIQLNTIDENINIIQFG